MNYELAKELKDAGYPQKGLLFSSLYPPELDLSKEEISYNVELREHYMCHSPTLSELIEACGNDLSHLSQRPGYPEGGKWWAVTHSKFDENGNNFEECGSSPEEAVARLWLALNKK